MERIINIKWYMKDSIAYYEVITKKGSFSIKDINDVPLLEDNQESKKWVIEHYSILFDLLF